MTIYIASRKEDEGILHCSLSVNGQLELLEKIPADRPAFLCRDGNRLYALLREPFQLMSGLNTYSIGQDGSLSMIGITRSTHGLYSAHLYAKEGKIWIANYIDGTVALLQENKSCKPVQDKIVAFSGNGPDQTRQLTSHPHCIRPTPDGQYLCVNDLGTDCIYLLTPDLELVSVCILPNGCGPRQLVFSPDGKYGFSSNELDSTVAILQYQNSKLDYIRSVSSLPYAYHGVNSASAISLSADGSRLYVSNRGYNNVTVFDRKEDVLSLAGSIPTYGNSPREFALVGEFLICGNELSDNVTVFTLSNGIPKNPVCDFKVTMPWCILAAD